MRLFQTKTERKTFFFADFFDFRRNELIHCKSNKESTPSWWKETSSNLGATDELNKNIIVITIVLGQTQQFFDR
jgi:hypothetical protein